MLLLLQLDVELLLKLLNDGRNFEGRQRESQEVCKMELRMNLHLSTSLQI